MHEGGAGAACRSPAAVASVLSTASASGKSASLVPGTCLSGEGPQATAGAPASPVQLEGLHDRMRVAVSGVPAPVLEQAVPRKESSDERIISQVDGIVVTPHGAHAHRLREMLCCSFSDSVQMDDT